MGRKPCRAAFAPVSLGSPLFSHRVLVLQRGGLPRRHCYSGLFLSRWWRASWVGNMNFLADASSVGATSPPEAFETRVVKDCTPHLKVPSNVSGEKIRSPAVL